MKTLLVNNNSKHFLALKSLIEKSGSKVISRDYDKLDLKNINDFDLVVLSGGKGLNIPKSRDKLSKEIELIKDTKIPIVGICLGFQLVADTFGAKLKKREEAVRGIIKIKVIKQDKIFGKVKEFNGYEAHKWYLDSLPANLICLAKSDSDIEIFKHKKKSIYGFQFHPEVLEKGNSSDKIFLKLLELVSEKILK